MATGAGGNMRTVQIVLTVVLFALTAPMVRGQDRSGLCPPGFNEMFNVNGPGCTFCYAPSNCEIACLGPPTCVCKPGDSACCEATPCCFNCPDFDSLACNTSSCECEPGSCCSTVCSVRPAPAASVGGIALLAAVLAVLGI